jgi:hypothetical protein
MTLTQLLGAARLSAVALLSLAAHEAEARQPVLAPSPGVASCRSRADGVPTLNGFYIYEENDSLIRGDRGYTQGLRVAATHNPDAHPCWVQDTERWRLPGHGGDPFSATLSYLIGQGLYTPRIITSSTPLSNDRGFADFNYIGASLSLTANDETLRYTAEAGIGALGVPGLAKGAQGGLHALKLHRIPKGWPTTSPNAPGFYSRAQLEKKWAWTLGSPVTLVDVVVGPAIEIGNVRTSAVAHGALRVGWALSGFGPAAIPPGATRVARRSVEAGAVLGIEGRAVGHTSLVSATPGSTGFAVKRGVYDVRGGLFARWEDLRVSYLVVGRSPEFSIENEPLRRHRFGSVTVGFEPSGVVKQYLQHWLLADWSAELGMGRNFGGPTLDSGTPGGVTAQVAMRKGLWKGLSVGVEAVVATAEARPSVRAPAVRPDVILRQQVATLGWGRDTRFGHVGVRAGTAWATKARVETTLYSSSTGRVEEAPVDVDYKAGRGGWMWGLQYFPPMERRMAIGLDVSRHEVKVDERMPEVLDAAFWKAVVLIRIRRAPTSR